MTSETQVTMAREFLQKAVSGEVSEAVQLLDPAVTYHVPGTSKLAGRFEGPEEVAQHLTDFVQLTNRRVDVLKYEDWLVGVNNVALLVQVRFQRQSMVETPRLIYLVSISDQNKISRVEVFWSDPATIERLLPQ